MISRNEFLYTRIKLEELKETMSDIEFKSETYSKWAKWLKLPQDEKDKLENSWNEYYKKCADSPWGRCFFEARSAFKKGIATKKVIEERMSQVEETPKIPMPSSIDPALLLIEVRPYFAISSKVRELQKTYDEYKGVYEKKDESDAL